MQQPVQRKEYSAEEIAARWSKKRSAIKTMSDNIRRLRLSVSAGLKSDNEKEFLKSLCVKIMDTLGCRIGNTASATEAGHYGCTEFKKSHIQIDKSKIRVAYVGKSGVKHEREFTDEITAKALKKAIKNSPSKKIFVTSDGFHTNAPSINRYLAEYGISGKDIRGWRCNKLVVDKLRSVEIGKDATEKERKKIFLGILKGVASKIGHSRAMLRGQYCLPELEDEWVKNGKIIDLKEEYKSGGEIKSAIEEPITENTSNSSTWRKTTLFKIMFGGWAH